MGVSKSQISLEREREDEGNKGGKCTTEEREQVIICAYIGNRG
jgi:hypothetical protein